MKKSPEEKPRVPVRRKLRHMVLNISIAAIALTGAVSLATMQSIRTDTLKAMTDSTTDSIYSAAKSEAEYADGYLNRYAEYIARYADVITAIYAAPEQAGENEVEAPKADNAGEYVMQLSYASAEISPAAVEREVETLGALEWLWMPMMKAESAVATVYAGTESGFMLTYDDASDIRASADGGNSYYNHWNTGWYNEGKESDGVFFTDLYNDGFGRGSVISCGAPFTDHGKFAGVVCADFFVTDIMEVLQADINAAAELMILDGHGCVIASPEHYPYLYLTDSSCPLNESAAVILNNEDGMVKAADGSYCAFARLKTTDWIVCISVPEATVKATTDNISHKIQKAAIIIDIAFLVIIIAVFITSHKFSAGLTKPLQQLQEDAEIISKGDLDHRAEVRSNDELGDLAESFNSMSESLKRYIGDLTSVTAERERIGAELNIAAAIQAAMLPEITEEFAGQKEYEIYAAMSPAKEVGGDFYDFFMVDERHLAVVMADVSGKGIPAAMIMAIGKTMLRDHSRQGKELDTVFGEINAILSENNKENMFITCFEAVLDLDSGLLRYVNAGHNPPLLRQNGALSYMKLRPGFILGGMEGTKYTVGECSMKPGDLLYLYTDGITEAVNGEGELFGEERLAGALACHAAGSMEELCAGVRSEVDAFVGEEPQFDDMTMLALKFQ